MTFRIIALGLFAVFYTFYLIKNIRSFLRIGRPNFKDILLNSVCYSVAAAEIASIVSGDAILGFTGRGILLKVLGVYISIVANAILFFAVLSIGRGWDNKKGNNKGLVTGKIYAFSRNPVVLSFDLLYLGMLLMYFNFVLLVFTIAAMITLHIRVLTEEKHLENLFGDEYLEYKKTTARYFGRGRWTFAKVRCVIYFITAVFSILYYFTCVVYAGFRLSFIWIWLLLCGFSIVRVIMLNDVIMHRETGRKLKFKIPKWLKLLYGTAFVIVGSLFIFVEVNVIVYMNMTPPEGLDYVIVLGAGLRGEEPTRPLYLRIQKAYNYMMRNPDTLLIASGGQGPDEVVSEAMVISRYLRDKGLDDERIILEEMSRDTIENIRNSFMIIGSDDVKVGLVTNGFHLYRACLIAKAQGHDNIYGVPAQTLFPVGIHYIVREFFGVVQLKLGLG